MKIIKTSDLNSVAQTCEVLKQGGVVSFPTDTVYGLAADATNFNAVEKLFQIKARDPNKPIAIFLKDLAAAERLFLFDETSKKLAQEFKSRSLTLVLKTKASALEIIASNLNSENRDFLGFRIISNKFVEDLLEKFDGILAVSSANPSSKQAATSPQEVVEYFSNSILDLLVDGGKSGSGKPSEVIKINSGKIEILRKS